MKKIVFCLLLALTAFSSNASAQSQQPGSITGGVAHEMPSWFTESFLDINEDVSDATDSDKRVMLFFHLNECPYCSAMLDENFRGGQTTDFIKENFSVIAINIKGDREISFNDITQATEKQISGLFKVQYTPTIIFLDNEGQQVFRTNGYRSPETFKHVLHYVDEKAYENMSLSSYIEKQTTGSSNKYDFLPHKNLTQTTYLKGQQGPVALLFEDSDCADCEFLHKRVLNHKDVPPELEKFLFVRLDAYSEAKVIDLEGNQTSPKQWADRLKLSYRPGIVLFDEGKEITRIDGRLFTFHFKEVLRFVSGKHYKEYPAFGAYLADRQQELVNQGVNINIAE